jgi:hypothetical protein
MQLPKISNGQAQIIIGTIGLAIGLYAIYQTKNTVAKAAQLANDALNPTKDSNIANKAANAVFGLDNKTASIGTKVYDFFHPEPPKAQQPVSTNPVGTGVLKSLQNNAAQDAQKTDSFWGQFK